MVDLLPAAPASSAARIAGSISRLVKVWHGRRARRSSRLVASEVGGRRPGGSRRQRERGGAEPAGPHRNLQHVVEAGRTLPLDDLAHGLDLEGAVEGILRPRQGGAQELEAGEVDVVAVAGVEDHVLGVALLVAHAQVVAEAAGSWAGLRVRVDPMAR